MHDQMGMESMLPELLQQAIWLEVLQWLSYALLIILCCSLVVVVLDFVLLFRQECQTAPRRPVNKQHERTSTHWPSFGSNQKACSPKCIEQKAFFHFR